MITNLYGLPFRASRRDLPDDVHAGLMYCTALGNFDRRTAAVPTKPRVLSSKPIGSCKHVAQAQSHGQGAKPTDHDAECQADEGHLLR